MPCPPSGFRLPLSFPLRAPQKRNVAFQGKHRDGEEISCILPPKGKWCCSKVDPFSPRPGGAFSGVYIRRSARCPLSEAGNVSRTGTCPAGSSGALPPAVVAGQGGESVVPVRRKRISISGPPGLPARGQ